MTAQLDVSFAPKTRVMQTQGFWKWVRLIMQPLFQFTQWEMLQSIRKVPKTKGEGKNDQYETPD